MTDTFREVDAVIHLYTSLFEDQSQYLYNSMYFQVFKFFLLESF
jgi:hypothetical protein